MKYIKQYLLFFVLILFVLNVTAEKSRQAFSLGQAIFPSQNIMLEVEIARTKVQREAGLMFRKNLPEDKGMIFIFENNEIQRVWMKNTWIALDVIFISEQGNIVSIHQGLLPCIKKHCDIYHSTDKVKYMLEINQGMVGKNNIKTGQHVVLTF